MRNSTHSEGAPRQPEIPLLKTGLIVSSLALAGTVLYVANKHGETDSNNTSVVRGVYAQVESHREDCGNRVVSDNYNCAQPEYYISVEQCESDIANAKNGKETKSYDPKVGEIYQGCTFAEVSVSEQTYVAFPNGSDIIWPGSPNDNVG